MPKKVQFLGTAKRWQSDSANSRFLHPEKRMTQPESWVVARKWKTWDNLFCTHTVQHRGLHLICTQKYLLKTDNLTFSKDFYLFIFFDKSCFQQIHFLIFYLFIYKERVREGEREGEKHQCVVASHMPPTGGLAHNAGLCPDWESNQ